MALPLPPQHQADRQGKGLAMAPRVPSPLRTLQTLRTGNPTTRVAMSPVGIVLFNEFCQGD
jgi:hypothetical protein